MLLGGGADRVKRGVGVLFDQEAGPAEQRRVGGDRRLQARGLLEGQQLVGVVEVGDVHDDPDLQHLADQVVEHRGGVAAELGVVGVEVDRDPVRVAGRVHQAARLLGVEDRARLRLAEDRRNRQHGR
ncbi:MAG: hypothetical protein ABSH27_10850 [Solirubrobacteraceae bacterium]